MTYSVLTRAFWHRIIYGASDTLAKVEETVRVQQALEGAATYVCEFKPTGMQTGLFQQGQEVTVDVVELEDTDGVYNTRRVFTGVIDPTSAAAYPNSVTSTCVGNLRKLRKTRTTDYTMTGKTDTQVARDILTFCGVPYSLANIQGDGYVLGAIKDVKWKKSQSGLEMLSELDRVFGYATIELGDGTVVRFPYSKVPSQYSDTIYGTTGTVKNYRAGTAGLTFYGPERNHGSMDEIRNFWRINGIAWEGAKDAPDEGCSYQLYAEATAENALLGSNVYQGDEFNSDLIQSEALAYKIAVRLMQWYNRTPDTVRIEGGNDPVVGVGHLIGVRDPAYGIELDTTQRYLVTNTNRDGDFMTIDAIGGPAGETGTVTTGIQKCCGTQRDDGTCDETGTGGTDGPNTPNVPEIPDPVICDPLESPNCIPDDGDEIDDPNFIDPLIGCTTDGAFIICNPDDEDIDNCTSFQLQSCIGVSVPDDVCQVADSGTEWWKREEVDSGPGYTCDCTVRVPWQTFAGVPYFRKNGSDIDAVAYRGSPGDASVQLLMSTQVDPDLQTNYASVRNVGTPLVFSISGTVTFNQPGCILSISPLPLDGAGSPGVGLASARLYSDPGLHVAPVGGDTHDVGMVVASCKEGPSLIGNAAPNTSFGGLSRNNGGYVIDSDPIPVGQSCGFSFSFDMTAHNGWGITYGTSCAGGGHIDHLDYLNYNSPLPGEPTDTPGTQDGDTHGNGHAILLRMQGGDGSGSFAEMGIILENVVLGYSTCESNPNYQTDIEDSEP